MLRSEDGRASAGVLLYSTQDLKDFEGSDLVARAAKLITKVYEQSVGQPLTDATLVPFESIRPGAKRWIASWRATLRGRPVLMEASKVFVEIAPGWVVQITVQGTSDDEGLTRRLLETLSTSSEPECYWPFIRQYFPEMR